jgi:GNAT superfamily N-acetyltransferase
MSEPTIRPAVALDLPAVRELMIDLGYDVDTAALESTMRDLAANPHALVLVYESEDGIDGLISVTFRPQLHVAALTGTIDELVTRRERRGRGIGHALVRAATDEARRRGAFRIELSTRRNRASYERGFYVSCGFLESPSALFRMVL